MQLQTDMLKRSGCLFESGWFCYVIKPGIDILYRAMVFNLASLEWHAYTVELSASEYANSYSVLDLQANKNSLLSTCWSSHRQKVIALPSHYSIMRYM